MRLGVGRQESRDLGPACIAQLAIRIRVQVGLADRRAGNIEDVERVLAHVALIRWTVLAAGARAWACSSAARRSRARDRRDMTVPIGTSSTCAASR
ncbi:Uncharacterised protein [Bordetella pertussis]|nr:Uncharacterised protein [Bordetella pertussis]CFM15434.1 Uncharacterised protein [Bordetella pertussis]CFM33521.1 Uncharacterised protein [Bordetella pertussis]CFM63433.1 Uncharacterised protein [Bordetella pertussis]CFM77707.1 Uncharacterised protein [Bordetella pertussis]